MDLDEIRLTSLAHGGGCGCKLSPAVLEDILRDLPAAASFGNLLVGTETGDDAAVWRLNDEQALVATTDFFMPIVDDPYDFGRIAAANALSDIYAMGGKPIMALAIVGMPVGKIAPASVGQILAGGAAVCAAAGVPVAGGHSIDCPEPIYGLVALGLVHPSHVMRNSGARSGDVLIATKGIGVGIYSAALKQGVLPDGLYSVFVASTTQLNTLGASLPNIAGVHAVTDVTGFALLGHTLEMCRGAGLGAVINWDAVPMLPGADRLALEGFTTGAGARNWSSYGDHVVFPQGIDPRRQAILCDPQTSGGLLIAVSADAAEGVLRLARDLGYFRASAIGTMIDGKPDVTVI